MFKTVDPLIARKRLPINPKRVPRFRCVWALIYPATPVESNNPVCRVFISGRYAVNLDLSNGTRAMA
jgi:hypothetical protein